MVHLRRAAIGLESFPTSIASKSQRRNASVVCAIAFVVTLALLPFAAHDVAPLPGFIPSYQSALIAVYGITTYLFFTQYLHTRSSPLLLLASGSLFTTGVVTIQLLSFPNIVGPGVLIGQGPATLTWLWTFWHLGPPTFALAYAMLEGNGFKKSLEKAETLHRGIWAVVFVSAALVFVAILTTRYAHLLPTLVEGDNYWALTTSSAGPVVQLMTLGAIGVLWRKTKLRTMLQLWLAVSLFLLCMDNAITGLAAARNTVGWIAGRLEALIAGIVLLVVYLREIGYLYARAEVIALERETARTDAERARDHLEVALEASGMGDWSIDIESGLWRRTPRHDRIFGYESASHKPWTMAVFIEHVVPEDRKRAQAAFDKAFQDGALEFDCRIKRADGEVRWIAMLGRASFDKQGKPRWVAGCVMDITERRRTEERLRNAERIESVGQLTGGVAHDFNNLLTIIVGGLDMIGRDPSNEGRVKRLADNALKAATRGAELTSKLLVFSRRHAVKPEIVNLNRVLQDFKPLMEGAVSNGVRIEFQLDLDASLHPTRIDLRQLEAALLNLVANARDAMAGEGGKITVSTSNIVVQPHEAEILDLPPGDYVKLSLADTGVGMDMKIVKNAFEPFFTTKDVGKGTGLGLSQVYGFARQAGGQARIESCVGKGTVVELYLPPSADRALPQLPKIDGIPLRRSQSGEVVLVVEDDAAVLDMAVEYLHDLGYRTLIADKASTALTRLKGSDRIDILFSDVVMPGGMNGVQLAVEARRLRPSLKVLLTSGYTASALENEHNLTHEIPLLSKPYAREDLAKTLYQVSASR